MDTTRFATRSLTETKTAIKWRANETDSVRSSGEFIGSGTREKVHRVCRKIIRGYESGHVPYRGYYRSLCGGITDYHWDYHRRANTEETFWSRGRKSSPRGYGNRYGEAAGAVAS